MAISFLTLRGPQFDYRTCEITVAEPQEPNSPYRAICTDVDTGVTIGSARIARGREGEQPTISATDVIATIGGGYRLASIAVDIEVEELDRRIRRVSERLRLRQRLWRRRTRITRPRSRSDRGDVVPQAHASLRGFQP
jgi:hypothetical protein